MKIKLRLLTIFLITFIASFAILNSRFAYANFKFWMREWFPTENGQWSARLPITYPEPAEKVSSEATLTIDYLGVSAPIVFGAGESEDDIFENLEKGIVHYSATPKPGQKGVSVILGHSSAYPWYKGDYGSVFALLGKLNRGDRLYVQYDDGRKFTYSVKQSIIFSPFSDDARLAELENNPNPSLVLVSCWPVGTNYKRIAVQAELI